MVDPCVLKATPEFQGSKESTSTCGPFERGASVVATRIPYCMALLIYLVSDATLCLEARSDKVQSGG